MKIFTIQIFSTTGAKPHKPRSASFHESSSSGSVSRSRSATTSCDTRGVSVRHSSADVVKDESIAAATKSSGASTSTKDRRTKPERPPSLPSRSSRDASKDNDTNNECTVCFEAAANAVFYKCGHVCCCVGCGQKLKMRGDPCPICRAPIDDVIRFYRP